MRGYMQFQKNQAEARVRRRTEHLQDIRQDADGRWSYEGEWMECVSDVGERRRVLSFVWCLLAAAAVSCLVCGCIRGTGMEGCWYVLIPYASSVFAVCFCARHLYAVTAAGGRMWNHHHAKHMLGLEPCLIWGFISSLLCVIGRLALAVFSGGLVSAAAPVSAAGSIWFLLLQAIVCAAYLAAFKLQKKLVWRTAAKAGNENKG